MQMNVGAHQLNDQGDSGAIRDQVEQRLLPENSWAQIQVIVFRPPRDGRLVKKRSRQPVCCLDEAIDRFQSESIGHYQKTVLLEGLPLLGFEMNKIQSDVLPLHTVIAGEAW